VGLIFASPFLAVWFDGSFENGTPFSAWRGLLIPPIVIIYVLSVSPGMERMGKGVLRSFREIVQLDNESLQNVINQAGSIPVRKELLAIVIGGGLGFVSALGSSPLERSWVSIYWIISNILMYALLVWTILMTIASTRLTNALLRQPLEIDPFDISPFEPIGRQSLLNALVFVGGISLSLIFVAWDLTILMEPGFWLVYIPLGLIPVVVFFINMFPTHRVLADAKGNELSIVRKHFQQACRQLIECKETGLSIGNLPTEINALAVYLEQIQTARTWPYNTGMLRTLFFSVLIPVGTLIGRIIIEALSN
jgi:hypothetical protein